MSHTGLVSLPVPVVGRIPGYETAHSLHVPVKRFTGKLSSKTVFKHTSHREFYILLVILVQLFRSRKEGLRPLQVLRRKRRSGLFVKDCWNAEQDGALTADKCSHSCETEYKYEYNVHPCYDFAMPVISPCQMGPASSLLRQAAYA